MNVSITIKFMNPLKISGGPILLFIAFFAFITSCDNQKSLKNQIKNLDNKNYEILDPYLKNKTVVGIGEGSHGDGELFKLKSEIIRHLHVELGFEAVLMEADFLAVENTLTYLSSQSKKTASNNTIQSTWANSKEFLSFIEYLQTTAERGDTLYFHGIDPQMTGTESLAIHISQAESFKAYITAGEFNCLISIINLSKTRNVSSITLDSLNTLHLAVKRIAKAKNQVSPKSYQWLKNIEGNLKSLQNLKLAPPVNAETIPEVFSHPRILMAGSIRDSLMSENVQFYLKKYKKVIIWAANKHLQVKSGERIWMGELLKNSLGDEYYSILVLYHHGVWSYPGGQPNGIIPEPINGTLAFEIGNITNFNISFLDIKSTNLPRIRVRTNNWVTTDSVIVNDFADAILFVKEATGSTMAKDND